MKSCIGERWRWRRPIRQASVYRPTSAVPCSTKLLETRNSTSGRNAVLKNQRKIDAGLLTLDADVVSLRYQASEVMAMAQAIKLIDEVGEKLEAVVLDSWNGARVCRDQYGFRWIEIRPGRWQDFETGRIEAKEEQQ